MQPTIQYEPENDIIRQALAVLESRLTQYDTVNNPQDTRNYLTLKLSGLQSEVFAVIFLDNRNRVIAFEILHTGTINGCTVHAREMVKRALQHNSAAVIFAHNHPSGIPEPSQADKTLTNHLKTVLEAIDIRVLDHIVIGDADSVSFAERGLL